MARYKRANRRVPCVRRTADNAAALAAQYHMTRLIIWVPRALAQEIKAKAKQFDVAHRGIISAAAIHGLRTVSASQIVAFATRYPDLSRTQQYRMNERRTKGHPNVWKPPSTDEQAPQSDAAA